MKMRVAAVFLLTCFAMGTAHAAITTDAPTNAPTNCHAPVNTTGTCTQASPCSNSGKIMTVYVPHNSPGCERSMEGCIATSRKSLSGHCVPMTVDCVRLGKCRYATCASDSSNYGKYFNLGTITYRSALDMKMYTVQNVTCFVHDTGGAFKGRPDKLDLATTACPTCTDAQAGAVARNATVDITGTGAKDIATTPPTFPPTPQPQPANYPPPTTNYPQTAPYQPQQQPPPQQNPSYAQVQQPAFQATTPASLSPAPTSYSAPVSDSPSSGYVSTQSPTIRDPYMSSLSNLLSNLIKPIVIPTATTTKKTPAQAPSASSSVPRVSATSSSVSDDLYVEAVVQEESVPQNAFVATNLNTASTSVLVAAPASSSSVPSAHTIIVVDQMITQGSTFAPAPPAPAAREDSAQRSVLAFVLASMKTILLGMLSLFSR